jgi:hypothetical protein
MYGGEDDMDGIPALSPVHSETAAVETCIIRASDYYDINPFILRAIYDVEAGKLGRKSKNSNGTYDHGPMQINTIWLKRLQKYNIDQNNLTNNACVNVHVATWILRQEIINANGDIWKGVGNYHSKTQKYHNRYLRKVYTAYKKYVSKWLQYYRAKKMQIPQFTYPEYQGSGVTIIKPNNNKQTNKK